MKNKITNRVSGEGVKFTSSIIDKKTGKIFTKGDFAKFNLNDGSIIYGQINCIDEDDCVTIESGCFTDLVEINDYAIATVEELEG